MLSRCSFGIHNYLIDDEVVVASESWCRLDPYSRIKIKGSEYERFKKVRIEICSRCKKERVFVFYSDCPIKTNSITVEFARREIDKVRGKKDEN